MPHIIIEYVDQQAIEAQIPKLLMAVHECVAASGLYEPSHIKTRAYPFRFYSNAGGDKPYIHVQMRIKSGRNTEQKKQASEAVLAAIKKLQLPVQVVTVEVIDMDRDSYAKFAG